MVNKTAAFATLLTLGGAANGGMAQKAWRRKGRFQRLRIIKFSQKLARIPTAVHCANKRRIALLSRSATIIILSLTVMENAVQEVGSVTEWPGRHIHCFR